MSDKPDNTDNIVEEAAPVTEPEPLKVGDRVTVSRDYLTRWPDRDLKKLLGRCGTVVNIEANRIDVQMDKTHPRSQRTVKTFFSPDALQIADPEISRRSLDLSNIRDARIDARIAAGRPPVLPGYER